MAVLSQFEDPRCASLQRLASTKDTDDVLDIADSYWADGSTGDCSDAIGKALEKGQQYASGTPVWIFFIGEISLFFVGDEASVRAAIALIEDDLKRNPDSLLAGTMHGICAKIYVALKTDDDYLAARNHLIKWYKGGIANKNNRGTVAYQIASLSQHQLNDTKTALTYYAILADEMPTDFRSHHSRIQRQKLAGESK